MKLRAPSSFGWVRLAGFAWLAPLAWLRVAAFGWLAALGWPRSPCGAGITEEAAAGAAGAERGAAEEAVGEINQGTVSASLCPAAVSA